jgi:hypothetical protein
VSRLRIWIRGGIAGSSWLRHTTDAVAATTAVQQGTATKGRAGGSDCRRPTTALEGIADQFSGLTTC